MPDQPLLSIEFLKEITPGDETALLRLLSTGTAALDLGKLPAPELLFQRLGEQERNCSSAVGGGIMLPHLRLPGLERLGAVIATLATPLVTPALPDGEPIRFAALLLIPEDAPIKGLRLMANLATAARGEDFKPRLFGAATVEELKKVMLEVFHQRPLTLLVSDIMVPPRCAATPEMGLKAATALMAEHRVEAIPVLEGKKLVGQLTSGELFKLGLPDFFSQLKSVGFIRFFDPFEKYFGVEAASRVADVMQHEVCAFPEDATLIEAVFALSVQKEPLICVVNDEHELLGVIDRTLVLQRIINI